MWRIEFNAEADKAFRKLDKQTQREIAGKLKKLQDLDDPATISKPLMHQFKGYWRIRVGSHRVIYRMERQVLLILVVDVGRRDSIYD